MAMVNVNVQVDSEQLDFLTGIGVDIGTVFAEAMEKRVEIEKEKADKPKFTRSFWGAGRRMGDAASKYRVPTEEEWEKMDEEILEDFKEYL